MEQNLIEVFKAEEYEKSVQWHKEAEVLRKKFVNDYPLESIADMALEDYVVSNEHGFCHRIQYELKCMASMGNARPDVFGIYLKGGVTTTLSKTYANIFGNDSDKAFETIKADIIQLLDSVKNGNYDAINKNSLNSLFKFRLIITYIPGLIVPVVAASTLEQYCIRVGVPYDAKTDMIYQNFMLRDWKDSIPEISVWSNEILMSFCDWLWRNNKKIDGSLLKREKNAEISKKVSKEIDSLDLKGIDKEAVVKARVNQGIFKERLLQRYDHCCLCSVSNKDFLIASHIKPWSESDENERLDVDNGFLLCPNHDKAFDKGYITFNENGEIMISKELDEKDRIFLNIRHDMHIELTAGNKEYLNYHRENLYKS